MKSKPHRFFLYLLLCAAMRILGVFPRRVLLALAAGGARCAFWLLPHYRRRTLEHLQSAFAFEKSSDEIQALAIGAFVNLAKTAADWIVGARIGKEGRMKLVSLEPGQAQCLENLYREGRGIIFLTAHLGNWELLGALAVDLGFEGAVIGRRIYYERFNRVIVNLRQRWGIRTIYRDEPPNAMLRTLKDGGFLGILPDQDVSSIDGLHVPFFGRAAYTPVAPSRIAQVTGAPILPMFLIREGDQYRLVIDEVIRVEPKGGREETVRYYTARWTAVIERMIRRFPDQWVWMHDRWRTPMPDDQVTSFPAAQEA